MRIIQFLIIVVIVLQSCSGQSSNKAESEKTIPNQELITKIDTKDSLSITGVKTIPSDLFNRSELKYLSIWGQDCDMLGVECFAISQIPNEIEKLENLEELHLTLNYITTLPSEILKLKKLRVLDLTENPGFNDIDKVVQMKWLEEFYCFGCHLSETDLEKLKQELPNCKIGTE
jgi:hypothetical protein